MPDTCRTQLAMRPRTSPSRRHLRDNPRRFSTPSDGRVASTNRRWPRGSLPRHLPFRHHSDRHPALRSRRDSPSPPLARPQRHLSLEDVSLGEFNRSATREADRLVYRLTRENPPAGALWRGLRALAFVERAGGSAPNGGEAAKWSPRSHRLSERVNSSPRSGGDRNDGEVGASACRFPERTATSCVSTRGRTMSR
jgi:hypothetical protein